MSLPAALREHPAVKGRAFYALPKELLGLLLKHIPKREFDKELLALEPRLSKLSGDHRSLIGYWNGKPVSYDTLREPLKFRRPYVTPGPARRLGSKATRKEVKEASAKAKDMVRMIEDGSRGYCGWLVTNTRHQHNHRCHEACQHDGGHTAERALLFFLSQPRPRQATLAFPRRTLLGELALQPGRYRPRRATGGDGPTTPWRG